MTAHKFSVLGVPVVVDVRTHDSHGTDCPFDVIRDPHIHLGADYGAETFHLEAFGPGVPSTSSVFDALDDPARWTLVRVPALPSWWDRRRGRTRETALDRMATRILDSYGRHGRAAAAIGEVLGR